METQAISFESLDTFIKNQNDLVYVEINDTDLIIKINNHLIIPLTQINLLMQLLTKYDKLIKLNYHRDRFTTKWDIKEI